MISAQVHWPLAFFVIARCRFPDASTETLDCAKTFGPGPTRPALVLIVHLKPCHRIEFAGAGLAAKSAVDPIMAVKTMAATARPGRMRRLSLTVGVGDAELLQRRVRTSGPFRDEDVPLELEIGHAHLAGEEARGGQVAEAVEEGDRVLEMLGRRR